MNKGSLQAKFDSRYRVDPESGCWKWTGSIAHLRGGYGRVKHKGRMVRAHRASFMLNNGEIPEGMLVCHRCDTPDCVNPAHLFIGTHKDNMADMTSKRRRHGEKATNVKLRQIDVDNIKAILNHIPRCGAALGRIYGVSRTTINYIKHGKAWA